MKRKKYRRNTFAKNLFLFLLGGIGYYTAEILYRGYSHISMALCGGICLVGIYRINRALTRVPLLIRALLSALFITLTELIFGLVVNLRMGLRVWDYSRMPFNFAGQICLPFSLLWFFLCPPLSALWGRKRK